MKYFREEDKVRVEGGVKFFRGKLEKTLNVNVRMNVYDFVALSFSKFAVSLLSIGFGNADVAAFQYYPSRSY